MKKIFLMLPILAALCFASCKGDQGPMGPEGPEGPQGPEGSIFYQKDEFTVDSKDWELVVDKNEKYYRYIFKYDELTQTMCDLGVVAAYNIWTGNDGVDYQSPLPCVRAHAEQNENGELIYYTTTIDYEFGPGVITFFVTNSDFFTKDLPPTMIFRVITHW